MRPKVQIQSYCLEFFDAEITDVMRLGPAKIFPRIAFRALPCEIRGTLDMCKQARRGETNKKQAEDTANGFDVHFCHALIYMENI